MMGKEAAVLEMKGATLDPQSNHVVQSRTHVWAGAAILGCLSLAYTLLYWNRFLAPSAGATSFYAAEEILRGRVPYRDFLFLTPPLHALKTALLIALFGHKLIVPRLDGMIERVIIAWLLYFWLVRFFRVSSVLLGVFFGILVFSQDAADSLANYHHDSVFWAVAAGLCASLHLDRADGRRGTLLSFASGVFAGLCFATKQTTGLGVLFAIPILVGLLHARGGQWRNALRFASYYAAGWAVPMGALILWLYWTNALPAFISSIFMASSSKGDMLTVVSRPFLQNGFLFSTVLLATAALALCVTILPVRHRTDPQNRTVITGIGAAVALVLGAASVYTAIGWPGNVQWEDAHFGNVPVTMQWIRVFFRLFHSGTLILPITGSLLIFCFCSTDLFRSTMSRRRVQVWFFSGLSFAIAYMLSLSWQNYSPMALPALALIVAAALDRFASFSAISFYIVLAFFCLLIYGYVGSKLMQPYLWMDWIEASVNVANHTSHLPKLAGLRLSDPTLADTEAVTRLILTHSSPSDTLLVYPYFPLFYVLTDRRPPTYAFNHYLDVAPDAICARDIQTLRAHPPRVIVYMAENLRELAQDEMIFRAGRPSGSRDVARTIEGIVANYRLLFTFQLYNTKRQINLYVRP